jgi:HD superfamily phosphodiesterase
MDTKILKLKNRISLLSSSTSFLHHKWFVKWHLDIVEQISLELCNIYEEADKEIVLALVWIHDYAKIVDRDNEHDLKVMERIKDLLDSCGFEHSFVEKVFSSLQTFESYKEIDLRTAPIEVQIVSSSDAASHFVGPFAHIYWYEFNHKSIEDLMEGDRKKLTKDWEKKITLPEIKKAFQSRYEHLLEQVGNLPNEYLNN